MLENNTIRHDCLDELRKGRQTVNAKIIYKKNQKLTARVVDLTSEGSGVVKVEGYPFFVEGVIPGELVTINVMKVGKSFGFARLVEINEPSEDRVEMTDIIGRQIGTMTLQHMSYAAQLRYKQHSVKEVFKRIGGFDVENQVEVRHTHGSDRPFGYRNKAQIPVRVVNGELHTGFFRKNSHQLIPVENFHIQELELDDVIIKIRNILREMAYSAYDEETHKGLIRHVIVKRGHYTGQIMVILVTNSLIIPNVASLIDKIKSTHNNIVSIVQNINLQNSNVILGRESKVLWGQAFYEDQMLGLTFKISAHSFYQVNTPQAEVLYRYAIEAAALTGNETVMDAYCGIGTMSLSLAKHAKTVYAMEIVSEAIDMAKENMQTNSINNVIFEAGAAEAWIDRWSEDGVQFDTAIVDPPRKGLESSFVETLIKQSPDRIVYVSCNPSTCARDCKRFAEAGYALKWVQPVDLFPQTAHVEAVCLLVKE